MTFYRSLTYPNNISIKLKVFLNFVRDDYILHSSDLLERQHLDLERPGGGRLDLEHSGHLELIPRSSPGKDIKHG